MHCQLLFARHERPGVLVLDCVAHEDGPAAGGVPCAVEVVAPGRTLAEQLAVDSIRRWDAADIVQEVTLSQRDGRTRIDVRSVDGSVASVEALRVVGLRSVGDRRHW